jgi:hypothetical protein
MGGERSKYGRREVHTRFWRGDLTERHHSENLGIDGRIILKMIFKKRDGEAWIHLA